MEKIGEKQKHGFAIRNGSNNGEAWGKTWAFFLFCQGLQVKNHE